jgi:aryl-alcohol dehydrogenase-like predicted oxidoreductase
MTMRYQPLGKSTLQAGIIGFGCMSLTSNDDGYNTRLLQQAAGSGINFFDTADLYDHGHNEIIVGKALKEKRKDIMLATKVGNQWRADGSGWDWNPRKEYILTAVEQSLQRLQTDYIDLYQLHGGTTSDPIDETIEAFELLKMQGKIRYYGISSIRPNVIREYVKRSNISTVMMQYSLLDRRPEESCLDLLLQHNIGVLARGSLAKGLLVNKPTAAFLNYNPEQVQQAANAITLLQTAKRSNTQTALQFVLQHPAIRSAVVGIRTTEQLEAALQTIDAPALTTAEMEQLQQVLPINQYSEHR